jgi:triosephosphate isomerase (TIM)
LLTDSLSVTLKGMERTRLVVGNMKMELSSKAEIEVLRSIKTMLKGAPADIEVVMCPSFVSLPLAVELLKNSPKIMLGAQNIHWEEKGAWTGQVSVLHINQFVQWCIIGHSEQRALTGETDDIVQQKLQILLKYGIVPIVCIGETAEERSQEQTVAKITQQMGSILSKATRTSLGQFVIAYEPIWAIGTGVTPDPNEVAATMLLIRKLAAERFDAAIADKMRVIYGGSVSPENVGLFLSEPGIDGVLVGGASGHPLKFVEIIQQVQSSYAH